jgi:hypothetical protein
LPASPTSHPAAGPARVADLLRGDDRPAAVLGAFPTALYLRLHGGEVIAVLTRDAVRLPLGLRLTTRSAEDPLDGWLGRVTVGSSRLRVGSRSVRVARVLAVGAATGLVPDREAVAHAWRGLADLDRPEPAPELLEAPMRDRREADEVAHRFLGAGPGLTPYGDDVLAGFLVGAWCFGLLDHPLRTAVPDAAAGRTTELSAALLRCASRGESVPEVGVLGSALSAGRSGTSALDGALAEVVRIGHTSGAGLASGLVAAARVAGPEPSDPHGTTA